MGIENNEAILATTWNDAAYTALTAWIATLSPEEQQLFAAVPGWTNHKRTIVLAPCGSKKGWDLDTKATALRERFITELNTWAYEDGSSPWDWIEVGYGEYGQAILRGNCRNQYDDRPYCL